MKDCEVLMKGLEKFTADLTSLFEKTKTRIPNFSRFLSVSSIGYFFAKAYGCFQGCYELSGKPKEFIQRCVSGGRVMLRNNQKLDVIGKIQDFDAVALYVSAMSIMDGVPKGIPKVIEDLRHEVSKQGIWKYNTFFIEINIKRIVSKCPGGYSFGQVYSMSPTGAKMFGNKAVDHFYVDKRGLQDLIEYYDLDYEVLRGYGFDEGFNRRINSFVKTVHKLREQYKKEKNPLQNTVKLLSNSIYGKSIMKETTTRIVIKRQEDLSKYIIQQYNNIEEITCSVESDRAFVKIVKTVEKEFTLPQFGASVLSWSKFLMNRVICLAEQNGIKIFYQDTDSIHIFDKDVEKLAKLFKAKYNQKLIGTNLTQFHSDFSVMELDSLPKAERSKAKQPYSVRFIGLGKKSYLDILQNDDGDTGFHIRMKGVPNKSLKHACDGDVVGLFEEMAYFEALKRFDLKVAIPAFQMTKEFTQSTREKFIRKLQFKGPVHVIDEE
jgi:hypothetical protein